jgi:hypothetical protein
LNNILEQDHRAIKRRVNAKQGFRGYQTAWATIQGYEAMHMIRKGQVHWVSGDDVRRKFSSSRALRTGNLRTATGIAIGPISTAHQSCNASPLAIQLARIP